MNFFRILAKIFKANMETGRRLTLDEFIAHETKKVEKAEQIAFYRSIAMLSISWAQVEVLLDYSNLFIINGFDINETQLPISLKSKVTFFKKYFHAIPSLETYRDRAESLAVRINNLKEARHDIIHGIARKKTPEGIRRYVRLHYKGKRLIELSKEYSLDAICTKAEEISTLAEDLVNLLTEMLRDDHLKDAVSKFEINMPPR